MIVRETCLASHDPPDRTAPGQLILVSVILLFEVVLLAAPTLIPTPMDRDEGVYAVVAREWAAGALPYRDVFDHKPPNVFLAYRLAMAFGPEDLLAPRVLWAALVWGTALVCTLLVREMSGSTNLSGPLAAGLLVPFLAYSPEVSGGTANTEPLMLFFLVLAAFAGLRTATRCSILWPLGAGLAYGLAMLSKPVCILEGCLGAAVVLAAAKGRRVQTLAALVAGAALPLLAWLAYFAARGGLAAFVEAVIGYNLAYEAAYRAPFVVRAHHVFETVAGGFLPASLGAAAAAILQGYRRRTSEVVVLMWCVVGLLQLLAMGRIFTHYLHQIGPPLSLATGLAVAGVMAERRGYVLSALKTILLLALSTALLMSLPEYRKWQATWASWDIPWHRKAAADVVASSKPEDRVLVLGGEAIIYLLADRRPASRYIYTYPLRVGGESGAAALSETLNKLNANPPHVIVVPLKDRDPFHPEDSLAEWNGRFAPALAAAGLRYSRHLRGGYVLFVWAPGSGDTKPD